MYIRIQTQIQLTMSKHEQMSKDKQILWIEFLSLTKERTTLLDRTVDIADNINLGMIENDMKSCMEYASQVLKINLEIRKNSMLISKVEHGLGIHNVDTTLN